MAVLVLKALKAMLSVYAVVSDTYSNGVGEF